jgi:hypothetical protein
MKKITRNITKYDEYTESYFTEEVVEYEIVTKFYQWLARKFPRRLIYFCYIEFMAFCTTHGEGTSITPDDMIFSKATKIWETYNK